MTRNDDPPIEEQIATEEARRDRMQAKRESRLSHDRGADAPAPNIAGCTCNRDDESQVGEDLVLCPLHEQRLRKLSWETLACMVIDYEAALSVPAPTLPALDADLLTRAWITVEMQDAQHGVVGRGRFIDRLASTYEALRDAV